MCAVDTYNIMYFLLVKSPPPFSEVCKMSPCFEVAALVIFLVVFNYCGDRYHYKFQWGHSSIGS